MNSELMQGAPINDPNMVLAFMFGEKLNHASPALTFRATKTGTHYTYRVNAGDLTDEQIARGWKPLYFVKLLTGSNNEEDYTYIGYVMFRDGKAPEFKLGKKSKLTFESQPVKAFTWALSILVQGRMPQGLEIRHEGRCGRCNRTLTTPESIDAGFGPDCLEMMGGSAAIASFAQSFAPAILAEPVAKSTLPVQTRKPRTPAAIVAAVNEDSEIAQMAAELWAKHPANPANQPVTPKAEPLPVDQQVAAALARSQNGWTVDDAADALSRRRIINLNIESNRVAEKIETLVGEAGDNAEIVAQVARLKDTDPEKFTMDGIMTEAEATSFWYRRFSTTSNPVEG